MPSVHADHSRKRAPRHADAQLEVFEARSLPALLSGELPQELQRALADHIRTQRWFRSKARKIRSLEILDHIALRAADLLGVVILRVHYESDHVETYVLPLGLNAAAADGAKLFRVQLAHGERRSGVVYDPTGRGALARALLALLTRDQTRGVNGRVHAAPSGALRALLRARTGLEPRSPSGEQSNTCVFYGRELILKLFRQLEPGQNPDVEINELLWSSGYRHVPEPLGSATYELGGASYTLAIVQRFVPSEGSTWDVTLDVLARSFELARGLSAEGTRPTLPSGDLLDTAGQSPPESVDGFISAYAPFAALLGERTAELHLALAAHSELPAFAPEPFSLDYQRSLVQSTRRRIARSFDLLSEQLASLPAQTRALAQEVLQCREALSQQLDVLDQVRIHASRIRCHGDYHLGQVLYGDNDFTILDFEGEPAQPLANRRQKLSALYDVAGMVRSFHYAATVALARGRWPDAEHADLARWSEAWFRWISATYVWAYMRKARERGPVAFLPQNSAELRALFKLHCIDKCSYELSYELNNRPAWVGVPLAGLHSLITRL